MSWAGTELSKVFSTGVLWINTLLVILRGVLLIEMGSSSATERIMGGPSLLTSPPEEAHAIRTG